MNSFGVRADSQLQATLRTFASQTVERKASEFVFHQGETPHGCYLVKSGKMRLSMESSTGHTIMEWAVGQGCLVGLPATINGRATVSLARSLKMPNLCTYRVKTLHS